MIFGVTITVKGIYHIMGSSEIVTYQPHHHVHLLEIIVSNLKFLHYQPINVADESLLCSLQNL